MRDPYWNAIRFFHALSRLFFRRITVAGLDAVPARGGGLLVAWHPNGIIDPVLIATSCPRPIVFGARHGLFAWPLLGRLLRAVRAVPIYRAADAEGADEAARRKKNRESLDALARVIAGGSISALFPEGVSHDAPHLSEIKVGAARLYYRATELAGDAAAADAPAPFILPVGLQYDEKSVFRSRALVTFHPPLELPSALRRLPPNASEAEEREQVTRLSAEIERALVEIVHPTESWELHHVMHRTRSLMRAERAHRAGVSAEEPDMQERALGFERVWRGYHACRQREPERTRRLLSQVTLYDAELHALELSDAELDRDPRVLSPWLPLLFALQALLVYGFLPPLLIAGYVINAAPYFLLDVIAKRASKTDKDLATVKMFGGMLLFPLTWALLASAAALGALDLHAHFPTTPEVPWLAASFTVALGVVGGFVALRYSELSRETLRALRVRLTRHRYKQSVLRLRAERAELHDAIEAMVDDVALPGRVVSGGSVTR